MASPASAPGPSPLPPLQPKPGHLCSYEHLELPSYGLACFDHLVGEYRSLSSRPNIDPAVKKRADELVEVFSSCSKKLLWSDLCAFEGLLLQFLTVAELRERVWTLEARYESLAAGTAYQEHAKSLPIDLRNANDEDLRARVGALLDQLHRLYIISVCRESMRDLASKRVSYAMIVFFVIFALCFFAQKIGEIVANPQEFLKVGLGIPTIAAVLFAGAMGGFISSQRRLQGVSRRGDSMVDLIELSSKAGYWLSPLTGAVFAAVLFMMLTGGFLKGQLFPDIASPTPTQTGLGFASFAAGTGPAAGIDWAKLLIWSFIAGFAERFVPDALDRVAARSQSSETANK